MLARQALVTVSQFLWQVASVQFVKSFSFDFRKFNPFINMNADETDLENDDSYNYSIAGEDWGDQR